MGIYILNVIVSLIGISTTWMGISSILPRD
jgi:hypothetical protein